MSRVMSRNFRWSNLTSQELIWCNIIIVNSERYLNWTTVLQDENCCLHSSVDVTSLTAGPLHVLAVGSEGDVYSWGQGSHGRLGLGTEENQWVLRCGIVYRKVMCETAYCSFSRCWG